MARRVTPMRGKSRHHVLSREGGLEVLHRDHGSKHGGARNTRRGGELGKAPHTANPVGDMSWRTKTKGQVRRAGKR